MKKDKLCLLLFIICISYFGCVEKNLRSPKELRQMLVNVKFYANIRFESNSFKITESFLVKQPLEELAQFNNLPDLLIKFPQSTLLIEGHADAKEKTPQILSLKRAQEIAKYLIEKKGVNPLKLKIRAYGNDRPIASNDTEEGRLLNRRVYLNLE